MRKQTMRIPFVARAVSRHIAMLHGMAAPRLGLSDPKRKRLRRQYSWYGLGCPVTGQKKDTAVKYPADRQFALVVVRHR